jgi:GNAT superfamily N-acetyltransferase
MPEPVLRLATESDLPRIAALARWVWLDSYASEGVSSSYASYLDRTFEPTSLQQMPGSHWIVESVDCFMLAWAHVDPTAPCPVAGRGQAVELAQLYVVPPAQGTGLGLRLLRHARELHPERALWLGAWEGNRGGLKFYRREAAELWGETWFELDGQRHRNEVLGWPSLGKAQRS